MGRETAGPNGLVRLLADDSGFQTVCDPSLRRVQTVYDLAEKSRGRASDSKWTKTNVKPVRNRSFSAVKADAPAWPATANSAGLRDERVAFLLSEVDLPRFVVLDSRIIISLTRVKPPITSIIRTAASTVRFLRVGPGFAPEAQRCVPPKISSRSRQRNRNTCNRGSRRLLIKETNAQVRARRIDLLFMPISSTCLNRISRKKPRASPPCSAGRTTIPAGF